MGQGSRIVHHHVHWLHSHRTPRAARTQAHEHSKRHHLRGTASPVSLRLLRPSNNDQSCTRWSVFSLPPTTFSPHKTKRGEKGREVIKSSWLFTMNVSDWRCSCQLPSVLSVSHLLSAAREPCSDKWSIIPHRISAFQTIPARWKERPPPKFGFGFGRTEYGVIKCCRV